MADNRKKNTVRKISKETKEIVYERDGGRCVLCKCSTQDEFHHCRFWAESIYTENRNDPDQLVLLCHSCHNLLHNKWDNNYREKCIEYLNYFYKNI
jgi:hypothetical protein